MFLKYLFCLPAHLRPQEEIVVSVNMAYVNYCDCMGFWMMARLVWGGDCGFVTFHLPGNCSESTVNNPQSLSLH